MGESAGRSMSGRQRLIYIGCTAAYATAYVGRLNMSAALPGIMSGLGLDGTQGGMLQTVFALTYAIGQIINGTIGDRISPRRFIFAGLIASAVANTLFGLANDYYILLAAWCFNGFAQSMLWTPVVRLVAGWFSPDQRPRVSFTMSMAMIIGHIAAWAISGYMARVVSWRWSFFIPAIMMAVMAVVSLHLLSDAPEDSQGMPADGKGQKPDIKKGAPLGVVIFGSGLWIMLLMCVCNGFARDSVITWAPSIIEDLCSLRLSSTAITLLIPVADCIGIIFIRRCQTRMGNKYSAIFASMVIALAMGMIMFAVNGAVNWIYPICLAVLCAVMYGINPLLTMLIPMDFQSEGRVGMVAGLVDCCIYLGSSIAGVFVGMARDAAGWRAVFALICAAALIGAMLSMAAIKVKKLKENGR